jgi:hypothetical protein
VRGKDFFFQKQSLSDLFLVNEFFADSFHGKFPDNLLIAFLAEDIDLKDRSLSPFSDQSLKFEGVNFVVFLKLLKGLVEDGFEGFFILFFCGGVSKALLSDRNNGGGLPVVLFFSATNISHVSK